jgi:diacylglycerol kinase (ATP)
MNDRPAFKKKKGIAHFWAAALYSWQGFNRLISEAAFRQELGAFFVGLLVLIAIGASLVHMLVFVVLMLVLFAFEAINTAIEELVDRVSPEISNVGKHAKDLGSFAVSCLIVSNGVFFLYALMVKWLD